MEVTLVACMAQRSHTLIRSQAAAKGGKFITNFPAHLRCHCPQAAPVNVGSVTASGSPGAEAQQSDRRWVLLRQPALQREVGAGAATERGWWWMSAAAAISSVTTVVHYLLCCASSSTHTHRPSCFA